MAIIDSYPLRLTEAEEITDSSAMMAGLVNELGGIFGADLGISEEKLKTQKDETAQIEYVLGQARAADLLPPEVGARQLEKLWKVFRANHKANHRYEPKPYPGRITLFRAKEKTAYKDLDLSRVWGERAGGGIDIHHTEGSHRGMVNEPHVADLAAQLTKYLKKE